MADPVPAGTVDLTTLESHLWEAANILRGPVDASDFKTFIFPLLFFKRISDVYDEEYQAALAESGGDIAYAQFAENHRFQISTGADGNLTLSSAAPQTPHYAQQTGSPIDGMGILGDRFFAGTEK